jgi:hypothetical protein
VRVIDPIRLASVLSKGYRRPVTKLRRSRAFAVAVTATAAIAWLFASNHCALAAVESPAKPASEHVCCHSGKGAAQPLGRSTQCCKALAAPVPNAVVAPTVHLHELRPAWFQAARVEASAESPILVVDFASATGPPRGALSFALLILNRSLLAHAPPHFVA